MKNQFAKIVAVLMVLAMAVSVFGLCASAAETTTEANTTVLLGDVNLDGKVSISDATLIQKAIAKLATLDEVQAAAAEVTEDGEVNIKDVTMIQKWLAKYDDVNENIGKPMATADEATPEEPTPDEKPVDPSTEDQPVVDPSTEDQPVVDPSTEDQPVVDPTEPTPAKFYTVAGDQGLCGVNWEPSQNVMTDDGDGTWSITFTGIAAGTYSFKVVENGAWGNPDFNLEGNAAGGGANAKVEVLVDNATVIIGFDGTKAIIEFVTAPEVVDPEVPATDDESTTDEASTDEATVTYYLVGYINGADLGISADWDNLGEYAFVDGTLTATFTADSYVQVKSSDYVLYATAEYVGSGNSCTLVANGPEKMFVPAGTWTFTFDADTLTLSYAA